MQQFSGGVTFYEGKKEVFIDQAHDRRGSVLECASPGGSLVLLYYDMDPLVVRGGTKAREKPLHVNS